MRYETESGQMVEAVDRCWIVAHRGELYLHIDEGAGVNAYPITMSEVVGGCEGADIVDDEPPETDRDRPRPTALEVEWSLETGKTYEWFDGIILAAAHPWWSADDAAEYGNGMMELGRKISQNLMHDPNFHTGMRGASREDRQAVADDMAGVAKAEGVTANGI